MERGCILLKDKPAKKASTWFAGIAKRVVPVIVLKGELLIEIPHDKLILRNDGKRQHNFRLVKDEMITVHAETDDIAPLNDHEFLLLVAIKSPLARYEIFISDKMEWGLGLKPGDAVFVITQGNVHVAAVIRCVVPVDNHSRILFGVEIMDTHYRGQGTTDGTFNAKRYFHCDDNCGLFVALDQLSLRPQDQSTQGTGSSVDVESQFTVGDRVITYNRKDTAVHGTVRWAGKITDGKEVRSIGVGIETDHPVRKEDFEYAITLKSQPFKVSDHRHGMVYLPEAFVLQEDGKQPVIREPRRLEASLNPQHGANLAKEYGFHSEEEMLGEALRQAMEDNDAKELEEKKKAVQREQIDIDKQREALLHLQKKKKESDTAAAASWQASPGAATQHPQSGSSTHDVNDWRNPPRIASQSSYPGNYPNQPQDSAGTRPGLGVGSTVQVANLPHHGVIRWVGTLPEFQGLFAGVELEDPMEGCGDGAWKGKRYFTCKPERGFFCPLASVKPEQRFNEGVAATSTPMTHRTLYKEKKQECSQLQQQLSEQSQAKRHLEQQCSLLKQQLSQQSQENQKIQEEYSELERQLQTVSEEHQREKKRIQEDQQLLHEEKHHLQGECTALQQQVVQQREAVAQAEQHCSLLKQQLSQQSQASQKIQQDCSELECQLQNMSEQHQQEKKRNLLIQEEQQLLHDHLQGECTMLQQHVVQQREAAAQAEVRYHQEIEDLQHRLDTALAEMQQLRPSSRTQVLVEDIDPWKVSRDEVQILNEMGRGAWGYVAKGRFRGQLVAVKSPHPNILNRHTTERLQREVRIMTQVRHPNLLRIIAAVFDNQVPHLPPLIVTELLDMNLRAAYENNRLSGATRIPIFRDVAYALHYLHEHQEPIIHRDVSAPNVLLEVLPNGMFKAKVSDFGSANLAKLAQTLAEGAIIYAAPETLPPRDLQSRPPPQTTKIDVYSYGILLCEVITCQLPDPQCRWSMLQEVKSKWSFMHDLIVSCTHHSPEDRLTMAQVLDKLNQLPRAQPRQRS